MILSYIRPDTAFDGAYEQLKLINSYASENNLVIDDEMIDQTSQSKLLSERDEVVKFLRTRRDDTLLIYDTWVLSPHLSDVLQMVSCLLKNDMKIHLIKQSVIIDKNSDTMLVLGLIDQLRQTLEIEATKAIGRPKGSRSSSKFDQYLDQILKYLREYKSVSEMARLLEVSRSSLKDYIESRELKEVAHGSVVLERSSNPEADVINTIKCPTLENKENENE